jgi:hypothetical protein
MAVSPLRPSAKKPAAAVEAEAARRPRVKETIFLD